MKINIDQRIAEFYAPLFLEGIKYGESQVNVWFPESGKTVITNDILSSKTLLSKHVGKISKRLFFIQYSCDQIENATAREILENIGVSLELNENELNSSKLIPLIIKRCNQIILEKDKEIVFVGNRYEDLSENEYLKLLSYLSSIVVSNKRRIYSIINSTNKPLIQKIAISNPNIFTLLNRVKFMPVISGQLLKDYIVQRTYEFNKTFSEKEIGKIVKTSGGVLFLTKEAIRSFPDKGEFDSKFKSIWNKLPIIYQNVFKKTLNNKEVTSELKKLGVIDLHIFLEKLLLMDEKPERLLMSNLNGKEIEIFRHFQKNKNKLVTKDQIAKIIWGENYEEIYSDWSLDQNISRFRKKLAKFGIAKESLITLKGKGYKWKY